MEREVGTRWSATLPIARARDKKKSVNNSEIHSKGCNYEVRGPSRPRGSPTDWPPAWLAAPLSKQVDDPAAALVAAGIRKIVIRVPVEQLEPLPLRSFTARWREVPTFSNSDSLPNCAVAVRGVAPRRRCLVPGTFRQLRSRHLARCNPL